MGIPNSKNGIIIEDDTRNLEQINQKDVELIKLSWNSIKNLDDLGISVMVRIFKEHKELKSKWIFATNLETEAEMLSNSQVRYHAKKIMDVLNRSVIKLLNTTPENFSESLEEFDLTRLGRNHFHYGVKRENFFLFEESLIFSLKKNVTLKNGFSHKMEKSWHKFFWTLVNKISDGIDLEEKDNMCMKGTKKSGEQ